MSSDRASTHKADILVVDANPDNQYLLSVLLIGQGYQVRKAADSASAFAAMKTKLPDSIVLNVALPGTNGYEVCQILKTSPETRAIPVILSLDSTVDLDKSKIFEVGGNDYLVAPYEAKEAIARVKTQLELVQLRLQVAEQQATIAQANQQLQHLTQLDGLTQVANRRQFDKHLTQEWRRLKRDRQPLSLILCDIDYFKEAPGKFESLEVEVIRTLNGLAVIEGVPAGARVVIEGAFFVQSEIAKSGFEIHNH